ARAQLDAADDRNRTALMLASRNGNEACVLALLAAGADMDRPPPLHSALVA
ncbi:ankyrin repeat domain-containing protein, partial [Klebsiella pneumoniae]|uniref:ankyrin repeat domain-containing protein n=1 Tax=Klebsiella pneumoniae TaxID=573 RepID=UPI00338E675A